VRAAVVDGAPGRPRGSGDEGGGGDAHARERGDAAAAARTTPFHQESQIFETIWTQVTGTGDSNSSRQPANMSSPLMYGENLISNSMSAPSRS
jgi:hypothetical protein